MNNIKHEPDCLSAYHYSLDSQLIKHKNQTNINCAFTNALAWTCILMMKITHTHIVYMCELTTDEHNEDSEATTCLTSVNTQYTNSHKINKPFQPLSLPLLSCPTQGRACKQCQTALTQSPVSSSWCHRSDTASGSPAGVTLLLLAGCQVLQDLVHQRHCGTGSPPLQMSGMRLENGECLLVHSKHIVEE